MIFGGCRPFDFAQDGGEPRRTASVRPYDCATEICRLEAGGLRKHCAEVLRTD